MSHWLDVLYEVKRIYLSIVQTYQTFLYICHLICLFYALVIEDSGYIGFGLRHKFWIDGDGAFLFQTCIPCGKTF